MSAAAIITVAAECGVRVSLNGDRVRVERQWANQSQSIRTPTTKWITGQATVANILLNSLINAACDATPGNPPSEQDVNGVLAAVHGIRANDEIEAMLAVQMFATHFAATRALRRLKGSPSRTATEISR